MEGARTTPSVGQVSNDVTGGAPYAAVEVPDGATSVPAGDGAIDADRGEG